MSGGPGFELSALVIVTEAADALIGPYRKRHTRDGARGLPAHVTVLYPLPGDEELTLELAERVRAVAGRTRTFDFALTRLGRFAHTRALYLEPEPPEAILSLTWAMARALPEYPPYEGSIPLHELHPHATVAVAQTDPELAELERELQHAVCPRLPVPVRADALSLFLRTDGEWRLGGRFGLLGGQAPAGARAPT